MKNTTFPSVEELNTIMKIGSIQRRIAFMVQMKNEITTGIRPLLVSTEDESADARYNGLYDQIDMVIAKDAKCLAEISEQKPPKI